MFATVRKLSSGLGEERTSAPTSPPTADLADPMVWFQLPSERLGSSFVIAPLEDAE
jgi:hypothetical protein